MSAAPHDDAGYSEPAPDGDPPVPGPSDAHREVERAGVARVRAAARAEERAGVVHPDDVDF